MESRFKTVDGVHVNSSDEIIARQVADYKSKRRLVIRMNRKFGTKFGYKYPKTHPIPILCYWDTEELVLKNYVTNDEINPVDVYCDDEGLYWKVRNIADCKVAGDESIILVDKIKTEGVFGWLSLNTPEFVLKYIEEAEADKKLEAGIDDYVRALKLREAKSRENKKRKMNFNSKNKRNATN
mgnify:CR=1 FL=1